MDKPQIYGTLKTRFTSVDKVTGGNTCFFDIETSYLVIDVMCPEVATDVEQTFRRINLKPYELAVYKFHSGDFLYHSVMFNEPGRRTITGLDAIRAATNDSDGKCPIVLVYLEFTQ